MKLDITNFASNEDPCEFSASAMELGSDAGRITWNNAVRAAGETAWVDGASRDAFEAWAKEFGAWDVAEIKAWSLEECNALLIQYISGDLRELESLCYSDADAYGIDWQEAEKLSQAGTIGGNIFKGDDGRLYFYMGS